MIIAPSFCSFPDLSPLLMSLPSSLPSSSSSSSGKAGGQPRDQRTERVNIQADIPACERGPGGGGGGGPTGPKDLPAAVVVYFWHKGCHLSRPPDSHDVVLIHGCAHLTPGGHLADPHLNLGKRNRQKELRGAVISCLSHFDTTSTFGQLAAAKWHDSAHWVGSAVRGRSRHLYIMEAWPHRVVTLPWF